MKIAGITPDGGAAPSAPARDMSGYSDDELMQIAGVGPYAPKPKEVPGFLQSVGEGVVNTPGDLISGVAEIPTGVSNVYESVRHPIESANNGTTERTLHGIGGIGAGFAGAGAGAIGGAEAGAVLGPWGAIGGGVIGGGLGLGAGLLGYHGINEMLGIDKPTTLQEDLASLGYSVGQGATLGAAAEGTAALGRGARSLFSETPDANASLLRSFKVTDKAATETLPKLQELKDSGIIADPNEIKDPFRETAKNHAAASKQAETDVQTELKNAGGATIADLRPEIQDFGSPVRSAANQSAITKVIDSENTQLTKIGLGKIFHTDDLEGAYGYFQNLRDRAASDPGYRVAYNNLKQAVEAQGVDAPDLRGLRISYDEQANFNAKKDSAKSGAFKVLRSNLQDKIVELGGGKDSALANSFRQYANLIDTEPYIAKMAGAELKNTTQIAPIGQRALGVVREPIRSFLGTKGDSPMAGRAAKQLRSVFAPAGPQPFGGTPYAESMASLPSVGASVLAPPGERTAPSVFQSAAGSQSVLAPQSRTPLQFGRASPQATPSSAATQGKPFEQLLDAIKEVESSGNTRAISKVGAKGPYQIMDATGREWHAKLHLKEPYDPFNEAQARRIAGAYLTHLIELFHGDIPRAVTAYHSGQGNVSKGKLGPEGIAYFPRVRSVFSPAEGA